MMQNPAPFPSSLDQRADLPPSPDVSRSHWFRRVLLLGVLAVASGGTWYWLSQQSKAVGGTEQTRPEKKPSKDTVSVEVTLPRAGGIDRVCVQPGSIEPFEAADLYAKVSGFLIEQKVDIGSRVKDEQKVDIGLRVKEGQPLAKIFVPEYEKQVQRDKALLDRAKSHVKQMEAYVVAAEAESRSAKSMIDLAKAEIQSKTASRIFRKKQFDRMKQLSDQKAIDDRLVDEKEDQFEAAVGAENAAKVAVTTAKLKAESAEAKILQAKADLEDAQAQVQVAEADLARAQVMLAYTVIVSPYDGVITRRSFNRGDFVRSADSGGDRIPLFTVERTDKMRVVVQVPDRDVPFVTVGDPATVEIDALPDRAIKTSIARSAESEDLTTRSMRTEIDVPNLDGKLRRGMYGRVTMILEPGHPDAVTVPSTALTGKGDGNRATIRIVRDGVVRILPVVTGGDNGVRVEILTGLKPQDQVILRANGAVEEGTPVTIVGPETKGGH